MLVEQLEQTGNIILNTLVAKNVVTGYYDFRSCGPLLACVWKDKRISFFVAYFCLSFGSLILNACVLQKSRNDRIKEQDYLAFHLALAVEFVGNSCRRSLGG